MPHPTAPTPTTAAGLATVATPKALRAALRAAGRLASGSRFPVVRVVDGDGGDICVSATNGTAAATWTLRGSVDPGDPGAQQGHHWGGHYWADAAAQAARSFDRPRDAWPPLDAVVADARRATVWEAQVRTDALLDALHDVRTYHDAKRRAAVAALDGEVREAREQVSRLLAELRATRAEARGVKKAGAIEALPSLKRDLDRKAAAIEVALDNARLARADWTELRDQARGRVARVRLLRERDGELEVWVEAWPETHPKAIRWVMPSVRWLHSAQLSGLLGGAPDLDAPLDVVLDLTLLEGAARDTGAVTGASQSVTIRGASGLSAILLMGAGEVSGVEVGVEYVVMPMRP